MEGWIWGLAGITLIGIAVTWIRLARQRPTKVVISNPALGVLNLAGSAGDELATHDLAVLASLFDDVRRSDGEPPICDVLLLYCDIGPDGKVSGSTRTLREIIRDSRASVVVVARDHPVGSYTAAVPRAAFGRANIVMTLRRKGSTFPRFLARIFSEMKGGVSMPVAWNKLAPQVPGAAHVDVPETVFVCEAGEIAFG